jgi:hypothetical protein
VNSINPLLDRFSLLLYCAHMGEFESQGYVDALELLNRSADFKYAADDRTTLMKLLSKQRQEFTERGATRIHRGVRLARRARRSQRFTQPRPSFFLRLPVRLFSLAIIQLIYSVLSSNGVRAVDITGDRIPAHGNARQRGTNAV